MRFWGNPPRYALRAFGEAFEQGRSSAFRQTILEVYDYACAACSLRVRLNDGFSQVEAAHLVPFNVTRDDNPNNGLALCPNHHRAMDRFLIAPNGAGSEQRFCTNLPHRRPFVRWAAT
jgi:putative restriction endonuclease